MEGVGDQEADHGAESVDPRHLGIADKDCRYDPTTAGAHILGRIERSFGYRKKLKA